MANATTSDRFATITTRNVFRLAPLEPQSVELPPTLNRPRITLDGVTTILGRAQALLTIHQTGPAKAAQTSCILSQGDSLFDVVVLEINAELGTVCLNNLGLEEILTLK